jgi:PIN domain
MKLYLDTNIYLSYLTLDSDVKSLEKLQKLIDNKKIELVLPSQTKKEYLRHVKDRAAQVKDKLKAMKTRVSIPDGLIKILKAAQTDNEKKIVKQVDSLNADLEEYRNQKIIDAKKHIEKVEKLLNEIFKLAHFFEYTDNIVLKAVIRYAKDLPPKKNDHKFGDAINWETLKENIRDDIVIVSTDPDFQKKTSRKNKVTISSLLASEWKKLTNKKAILYTSLGQFVNTLDKNDKVSQVTIKKETLASTSIPYLSSALLVNQGMNFSRAVGGALSSVINTSGIASVNSLGQKGSVIGLNDLSAGALTANASIIDPKLSLASISRAGYMTFTEKKCSSCQKNYSIDINSWGFDNGLCDNCKLFGYGSSNKYPFGNIG